jgi:CBS-domain-containing membrane protein
MSSSDPIPDALPAAGFSMRVLLARMRGGGAPPAAVPLPQALTAGLGGVVAIGLLTLLATWSGAPLLLAPFGATCVLVFALPDSPLAQPRSVIGGHLLSTLVGLAALHLFGGGVWAPALAVGAAIALMQLTRTTHAPAGADPLVVLLSGAPWSFLIAPVLVGSVLLVCCALLFNNLVPGRSYPRYWL